VEGHGDDVLCCLWGVVCVLALRREEEREEKY
jgi:hypothetical protein